ncbi:unnamed protein product, partial [Staurois parvus]
QVRIIWINSRGIESTGLIGSSGWISSSCWVEHQAECRRPAEGFRLSPRKAGSPVWILAGWYWLERIFAFSGFKLLEHCK